MAVGVMQWFQRLCCPMDRSHGAHLVPMGRQLLTIRTRSFISLNNIRDITMLLLYGRAHLVVTGDTLC